MSKNTLIGIVAMVIIIIVFAVVYFPKINPNQQGTQESNQSSKEGATPASLDESMKETMEKFEPICTEFLAGEMSGDPNIDCPGFENPFNRELCFYCYAKQNQDATLCLNIDSDSGFKIICERATGSTVEEILGR